MAKASEIPGLHAGMTYAEAAARTISVRGEEVFKHEAGVLDVSDIERVHAMRVATRRLRAVMEIYAPCFPADRLRPVLRDVKALADALGARRDPDVELLALGQFAASLGPDERPGIELFIERTRAEQEDANRRLSLALDAVHAGDLRGRIAELARLAEEPERVVAPPAPLAASLLLQTGHERRPASSSPESGPVIEPAEESVRARSTEPAADEPPVTDAPEPGGGVLPGPHPRERRSPRTWRSNGGHW